MKNVKARSLDHERLTFERLRLTANNHVESELVMQITSQLASSVYDPLGRIKGGVSENLKIGINYE